MSRRALLLLGSLALVVAASSCSGDEVAHPTRTVPPGTQPATTTTADPTLNCAPTQPAVPAEGKPDVKVPEGPAPTTLQSTDLKVGDGPEAVEGATVKMQYVGVSKTTGKEFDSSWKRNAEPFPFTIGPTAQVIKGWNQGVPGMKVGGRRQLVIPPDLGYGPSGQGADIPPNDTLIFVVDLVQVCTPIAAGSTPATAAAGASIPAVSEVPTTAPVTTVAPAATTSSASPTTASTVAPSTTATTAASTTTAKP